MDCVYLNGQMVARDAAKISVFDRGFVFGDGVYEVIPAYGGRLFRLQHHLDRLDRSLDGIHLRNPLARHEWAEIFTRLLAERGTEDQYVYMQVTRGIAPRDHAFPAETEPTVFAYAQPLQYPSPALVAQGVAAITVPDIRWGRCDIKAVALLANVMMRQEAVEQGAAEAILLRDGFVTEGAASNIFIVQGHTLITPPKGPHILPGVTRDLVLELARTHGVDFSEDGITERALFGADEVWLTSSTREILAITRINDSPIGEGRPGPMFARLYALYQQYKQAFRAGDVD